MLLCNKPVLKVILLDSSFYTSASLQEFWKPSQTNYKHSCILTSLLKLPKRTSKHININIFQRSHPCTNKISRKQQLLWWKSMKKHGLHNHNPVQGQSCCSSEQQVEISALKIYINGRFSKNYSIKHWFLICICILLREEAGVTYAVYLKTFQQRHYLDFLRNSSKLVDKV